MSASYVENTYPGSDLYQPANVHWILDQLDWKQLAILILGVMDKEIGDVKDPFIKALYYKGISFFAHSIFVS